MYGCHAGSKLFGKYKGVECLSSHARLVLEPRQQLCMHNMEAGRVDEVNIRPFGYQWSVPVSIPKLYEPQDPRGYPLPQNTRLLSAAAKQSHLF